MSQSCTGVLYRLPEIPDCFVVSISRSTHILGQIPNGDKDEHDKQKNQWD